MSATYITRQGETVDIICRRHYGRTRDVTELVLGANPGLAGAGAILPMGTTIHLPDAPERTRGPTLTSLWD